jgi:hypothetical protein
LPPTLFAVSPTPTPASLFLSSRRRGRVWAKGPVQLRFSIGRHPRGRRHFCIILFVGQRIGCHSRESRWASRRTRSSRRRPGVTWQVHPTTPRRVLAAFTLRPCSLVAAVASLASFSTRWGGGAAARRRGGVGEGCPAGVRQGGVVVMVQRDGAKAMRLVADGRATCCHRWTV